MGKVGNINIDIIDTNEVYIFSMKLCDNEIDCDNERFTIDSLHKLAKLFIGTTGSINIPINHSALIRYGVDRTGKIYDCKIKTKDRTTSQGEIYTYLVVYAYIPITDNNQYVIEKIKHGTIKDISLACSIEKSTCNICGADLVNSTCDHIQGNIYSGVKCCKILDNPREVYEWSFTIKPLHKVKLRRITR